MCAKKNKLVEKAIKQEMEQEIKNTMREEKLKRRREKLKKKKVDTSYFWNDRSNR